MSHLTVKLRVPSPGTGDRWMWRQPPADALQQRSNVRHAPYDRRGNPVMAVDDNRRRSRLAGEGASNHPIVVEDGRRGKPGVLRQTHRAARDDDHFRAIRVLFDCPNRWRELEAVGAAGTPEQHLERNTARRGEVNEIALDVRPAQGWHPPHTRNPADRRLRIGRGWRATRRTVRRAVPGTGRPTPAAARPRSQPVRCERAAPTAIRRRASSPARSERHASRCRSRVPGDG